VIQLCAALFVTDELIAYWLIGKKRWYGWLVKLGGLIPLTAINIAYDLYLFHVLNAFFVFIYLRTMQEWRKQ
jgi:hypothetical protein